MSKMKLEDLNSMLEKAVSDVIGNSETETGKDDGRLSAIEKSVSKISAQIQALTSAAANGFEKPKSTEEIFSDFSKKFDESIAKMTKAIQSPKDGKEEDDPEAPVPSKKGDLVKMIEAVINKALEKNIVKGKPKGDGKDDSAGSDDGKKPSLQKMIDGLDKDDINAIAKSLLGDEGVEMSADLEKEMEDAAGNPLSAKKKAERAKLDSHFGKVISRSRSRVVGDNDTEDDNDNDDSDEGSDE